MLKKILLLVAACLLLLTMPVLAADADQSDNGSSQPSAYSQSGECQGGACTWKR